MTIIIEAVHSQQHQSFITLKDTGNSYDVVIARTGETVSYEYDNTIPYSLMEAYSLAVSKYNELTETN